VLVPLAVNPATPGVGVAVHEKVAPLTSELSIIGVVEPPEQIVCVNGVLVTVGIVLTVARTEVLADVVHPFAVAST
jgi:hypothetical protein